MTTTPCPCSPEKEFDQCCGPYLAGEAMAPTAEILMRSRFTAYVRDDHPYLLRTWESEHRPKAKELEGETGIHWTGLKILRTEAGGPDDQEGVVEFIANFQASGTAQSLHEVSTFVREDGQWVYVDGDIVRSKPIRNAIKIGRNDPCHCGSGKKYKKCCARN